MTSVGDKNVFAGICTLSEYFQSSFLVHLQGGARNEPDCWLLWVRNVPDISQGIVAMCSRSGGTFNESFFKRYLLRVSTVKEL